MKANKCFKGKYLPSKSMTVKCGKCPFCRLQKRREWASRIIQENIAHTQLHGKPSYFVTLTYSDENLPRTPLDMPTLRKADMQAWLNNMRNTYGPFRHFTAGEYGDRTMRPHYHMALFSPDPDHCRNLANHWTKKNGFVQVTDLTPARCAYLIKYATKAITETPRKGLRSDQEPWHQIKSRGLSGDFFRMVVDAYRKPAGQKIISQRGDVERVFRYGGKNWPLTDYTLRKIRAELGIPEKHSDREWHENYLTFHSPWEAENDPEKAKAQGNAIKGRQKENELRYGKL
jgi:hypothetical protein